MVVVERYLKRIYNTFWVVESGLSERKIRKHFPTTHYIVDDFNNTRIKVVAWIDGETTWYKIIST